VSRIARLWIAWLALGPGCTCRHAAEPTLSAATSTGSPASPGSGAVADAARPTVLDVVGDLDACAFGHRGALLDFGDPSMRGQMRPGSLARDADEVVERGGATWLRVRARSLSAAFYWPLVADDAVDAGTYVEARVRGVTARAVSVAIDGKHVGDWALARGEVRTVAARATAPITLAPGGHELTLRFVGGSRGGDALAEIDWVHVGTGGPVAAYAAPTRADVSIDPTVGGRSIRALSLRSPGFVRCSGWIPANATLEASLATLGGGDADVEAQLLRDRSPPVVLGRAHVTGASGAWAPWSVPITGLEGDGALASIELVVEHAGETTRVLLGSPRLVAAQARAASPPPAARGVLLVVLGSTAARSLAPWGGPHEARELSRLASSGTRFAANRASSSIATAVVASMLTGLPPQVLGLEDADTRLPRGPTTIAEACRQAGIATAMFTANPTTGAAFGFDRGWDSFVAHDPLEDTAATRVFEEAAAWIQAHDQERFLVVVHARGGHPPWDATSEELKSMPPPGYFGILEPRRAAEGLSKARRRGHFKEEDRVRAWALYDRALDAHDEALGRLLAGVRTAGRADDTAVIVTGDVGPGEAQSVPFVDLDTLDEGMLATPLVVRWPRAGAPPGAASGAASSGAALSGQAVDAPTGPEDVGRTVLAALGLAPPPTFQGVDLAMVAQGGLVPSERPLAATCAGRFAVRWGPFVLVGSHEREARMCDLSLDPTCVADVRATSPLALEPLHRWAVDALATSAPAAFAREGAVLDQHTVAALVRWGRPTEDSEAIEKP
jgi:arylsulfatase A-like enzyme